MCLPLHLTAVFPTRHRPVCTPELDLQSTKFFSVPLQLKLVNTAGLLATPNSLESDKAKPPVVRGKSLL